MDHNYFTPIGPFVYGDYVTFKEGENKGKKLKIVDAMEVMSTLTFQPIIRYGIDIDGNIRYANEDEIIPYEMYKAESNKNSDNIFRVKIVNKSKFPSPAYATKHSAGMDIRANIEEDIEIKPLERVFIPTGLYIALPNGYEAQLRPRSGLACKHGITVANAPGTIN